jgi:hypothetical protein
VLRLFASSPGGLSLAAMEQGCLALDTYEHVLTLTSLGGLWTAGQCKIAPWRLWSTAIPPSARATLTCLPGGPGSLPSRASHRSVRAQFGHTAPLRRSGWPGTQATPRRPPDRSRGPPSDQSRDHVRRLPSLHDGGSSHRASTSLSRRNPLILTVSQVQRLKSRMFWFRALLARSTDAISGRGF